MAREGIERRLAAIPSADVVGYSRLMGDGAPVEFPSVVDAVVCAAGGATNIWRPHAVGEGGVFRGSHAIGPCVDNYWLALG